MRNTFASAAFLRHRPQNMEFICNLLGWNKFAYIFINLKLNGVLKCCLRTGNTNCWTGIAILFVAVAFFCLQKIIIYHLRIRFAYISKSQHGDFARTDSIARVAKDDILIIFREGFSPATGKKQKHKRIVLCTELCRAQNKYNLMANK